jgi:precorrin-2 dehydrogenase / sirohydrochlorin ferrochelatase
MDVKDNKLFPVFLNLKDKDILIVGGGKVALEKLSSLLPTGARVNVIATRVSPEIVTLSVSHPTITFEERPVLPTDLDSRDLIFLATNDSHTNYQLACYAKEKKIWVNSVDDPPNCEFFSAAVFDKGALRIAVSTEGKFAGLSSSIKKILDILIPDAHVEDIDHLTTLRNALKEKLSTPQERMLVMRKLLKSFEQQYFEIDKIQEFKKQ